MAVPPLADLEFHALRNALYHTARRQFLERSARFMNMLVIVGGAASVSQLFPGASAALGIAITVVGALQLVFDFGGVARQHQELQRRYYDVLSRLTECTDDGKDRALIWAEILRISGEEPPTYRAVDAIAHNEATDALYGADGAGHKIEVKRWHNATRHVLHHNGVTFV